MAARRILGVDPGLTRCGVGVIEEKPGRKVGFLFVDTFRADKDAELSSRIGEVADAIEGVITEFQPSVIALERVFAQANLRSVMGVAQISGVVLYLAKKHGIPVVMHTPSEVKAAVTGSGRAAKAQIGNAVARILGLESIPGPPDSADALAIAITHSWRGTNTSIESRPLTKAQLQLREAQRASKRKR